MAATGDLTQKAGTAGCISDSGSGGACADGTALDGADSVTVSADGKSVYVTSNNGNAVVVFDRAADGSLTQKAGTAGCISDDGSGGACADGKALLNPTSVTVSSDGKSAYVASVISGAVAVFDRAADGTLTQKAGTAGCISDSGSVGACADGSALGAAFAVTVSPDGKSAYVTSQSSDAVAVFDRALDGTLTQKAGTAGCISESGSVGACAAGRALNGALTVTVSPDGKSAYVASQFDGNAVAVFDRAADGTLTQKAGTAGCISNDGSGGVCADGSALDGASSVTVSPDGKSAYVASVDSFSDGAVAVFDRAADGTLSQKAGTAGCISDSGSGGACADGTALKEADSVTVSPDGESAYVTSVNSNAVVVFDRAGDGTLTQKVGTAGCISNDGSGGACADGTALTSADWVAVSPDGKSVYVTSGGSGAVAVFDRGPTGTTPPSGGQVVSNPPPDGDGDGVPNATDRCPLTAGPSNNSGCPANAFSFAGKPLRRNGYTILKVKVPGPGRIKAAQAKVTRKKPALIKAVAVSAKRAGQVTLKLKPTKAGKKVLAKRGKFTVKAKITYTPTGGKGRTRPTRLLIAHAGVAPSTASRRTAVSA